MPSPPLSRRDFLSNVGRGASLFALGGAAGALGGRSRDQQWVWQIDPFKCTQCSRCATECVLDLSAVKCVQDLRSCGYCRICFGYQQVKPIEIDSAAENLMCPTDAIVRKFVEEPYYEYTIQESKCNGCAKCVKACLDFGNASFYLQVRHDRCLNCNECAIAAACPANAFVRLPADDPYVIKSTGATQLQHARPFSKANGGNP